MKQTLSVPPAPSSAPRDPACCGHSLNAGAPPPLRAQLPEGHVLATFMDEHQRILAELSRLEALAQGLCVPTSVIEWHRELKTVRGIAGTLIGAEPHHRREEEVLFPALEERGVHGPPEVMAAEHVELRALKHRLLEQADAALASLHWQRGEIAETALALVRTLRDHIAKEDQVLYPMSFGLIRDPAVWDELRRRCDAIGYCCHAPLAV